MKPYGYNSLTSWLILIPCSIIHFMLTSVMRLAGLFFVIILDGYDTDRETAAIPIAIFGTLRAIAGPLAAVLGEVIGYRAVTLTGCFLGAAGVGCCFFAEDITSVIISLGLIYGLGMSLGLNLMPTILNLHFNEHVNLVNGIILTGSCLGAIVMSPVAICLQNTYGIHGMFLICGGILLNCVPAAILLSHPHNDKLKLICEEEDKSNSTRTVYYQNLGFSIDTKLLYKNIQRKEGYEDSDKYSQQSAENEKKNKEISRYGSLEVNKSDLKVTSKEITFSASEGTLQNIERQAVEINSKSEKDILNDREATNVKLDKPKAFRLFTDPVFNSIMIVQSLHGFVTTLHWAIIVDYARDKGFSNEISNYFSMFVPLSEIVGFMCFNWITDRNLLSRTNFNLIGFSILILDTAFIIFTYDFVLVVIGVLIFGIVSSAVCTTFPGIIIEFIDEKQQTMALASRFCLYGVFCMLKIPIIGFFRGTLGSYDWVYCIIIACSFVCCILVKLTPILALRANRKKLSRENKNFFRN